MTDKTVISFEELISLAGASGLSSERVGSLRQQYGANVMTPRPGSRSGNSTWKNLTTRS